MPRPIKTLLVMVFAGVVACCGLAWSNEKVSDTQNKSGHEQALHLGGPDGVSQELEKAENPDAVYPRASLFQPYFDWKTQMKDDHGLSFGLSAILLYQYADETLPESKDDAFGGIFRFQGSWVAFAQDSGHPGRIEWRVENRSNLAGLQSPSQLSGAVGAVAPLRRHTVCTTYSRGLSLALPKTLSESLYNDITPAPATEDPGTWRNRGRA